MIPLQNLAPAFLAWGLPGFQEWAIILVIGLLIFGRNLPDVGRQVGRVVGQLRRGLNEFKSEINADEGMRQARSTVHDLKRAINAPRSLRDPRRVFDSLTNEDLSSPAPRTGTESASPEAQPARPDASAEAAGPAKPGAESTASDSGTPDTETPDTNASK